MSEAGWAIDIDREDITKADLVEDDAATAALAPGQVRVRIDCYAMTANNITYAVFGQPAGLFGNDQGYWDFFAEPAAPGRLPVWGFATVERSAHPDVKEGERVYGYLPMSRRFVVCADNVRASGFDDVSAHRRPMSPCPPEASRGKLGCRPRPSRPCGTRRSPTPRSVRSSSSRRRERQKRARRPDAGSRGSAPE